MDAQLQTAVTAAGNTFGNDTNGGFQDALAQSICGYPDIIPLAMLISLFILEANLLVSWAAGTVEIAPSIYATSKIQVVGVEIPIALAYIFSVSLLI